MRLDVCIFDNVKNDRIEILLYHSSATKLATGYSLALDNNKYNPHDKHTNISLKRRDNQQFHWQGRPTLCSLAMAACNSKKYECYLELTI